MIYTEYASFSDEETVLQIQENPYLQYFCGLPGYTDERPFDPSLMVHFRKRLTPEILGEINEMIIAKAVDENPENHDDNGDLIVDATCAPQDIKQKQKNQTNSQGD